MGSSLSHDDKMADDVNERTSLLGNFRNRNQINVSRASVRTLRFKSELKKYV